MGKPRDTLSNAELIGGRYQNLMATIVLKNGDDVPSGEGMWRPRAAISRAPMKKNFDTGWSHGSVVIVEIAKYLYMSR